MTPKKTVSLEAFGREPRGYLTLKKNEKRIRKGNERKRGEM